MIHRNPLVSIIILNYNGEHYLRDCIRSVSNSSYANFEIILVDNASKDQSLELVGKEFSSLGLRIVRNTTNFGYALGNNIGAACARGDLLVFLNVDTRVDPQWLQYLVRAMLFDESVGVVGPVIAQLRHNDLLDSFGHAIDWFGVAHVLRHNAPFSGQLSRRKTFSVSGASLVVKKNVFSKIGGFDKDFFMFFEEDDLCWRAWGAGYSVVLEPRSKVYHEGAGIRGRENEFLGLYLSRRNRLVSLLKNYELKNLVRFFPCALVLLFIFGLLSSFRTLYLRAYARALFWVVGNFPLVLAKRRTAQALKNVKDAQLIVNGIIRRPSLRDWLRSGF